MKPMPDVLKNENNVLFNLFRAPSYTNELHWLLCLMVCQITLLDTTPNYIRLIVLLASLSKLKSLLAAVLRTAVKVSYIL